MPFTVPLKSLISPHLFALILNFFSSYRVINAYPTPDIDLYPGESIWPKPQDIEMSKKYISITKSTLEFEATDCDSINSAFMRFIDKVTEYEINDNKQTSNIDQNDIILKFYPIVKLKVDYQVCEKLPNVDMNEKYTLAVGANLEELPSFKIGNKLDYYGNSEKNSYKTIPRNSNEENLKFSNSITIQANSNWGILHAFTTLSQMLFKGQNLNITKISDYPKVNYRGILLDTSRHYLPISTLKRQLEIMHINKFNVFHWHIVDDNSFPFQSKVYPKLLNPWTPDAIYTIDDVSELIDFAGNLGIRIIPEFDTPGHTQSWENVDKKFITKCPHTAGKFSRPLNPTFSKNYEIITNLYKELRDTFKDDLIHIGGDEVAQECWAANKQILKFMEDRNITSIKQLESNYIAQLLKIVKNENFVSIVWEDVWQNFEDESRRKGGRNKLPKHVIVECWKSWTYNYVLPNILQEGYKVILSAPWYLDLIKYGESYKRYYEENLPKNLYGGEACLWSEFVDETNLESRLWPSASAVAERLWTNPHTLRVNDYISERLNNFRCYLRNLGYEAQPVFPSAPCSGESGFDEKFEIDWVQDHETETTQL